MTFVENQDGSSCRQWSSPVSAGPGQITIDTSHAAVGLIDVLWGRGDMTDDLGLPQPPYVPGGEVADTVREICEGVEGFVSASL